MKLKLQCLSLFTHSIAIFSLRSFWSDVADVCFLSKCSLSENVWNIVTGFNDRINLINHTNFFLCVRSFVVRRVYEKWNKQWSIIGVWVGKDCEDIEARRKGRKELETIKRLMNHFAGRTFYSKKASQEVPTSTSTDSEKRRRRQQRGKQSKAIIRQLCRKTFPRDYLPSEQETFKVSATSFFGGFIFPSACLPARIPGNFRIAPNMHKQLIQ